jgi:cysteine desulfurase / selenocysteine lyase
MICKEKGAILRVIPINNDGEIVFEEYVKLLSEKTKIVAITHVSNTLGTINPIKKVIDEAHKIGIPVLIDGAQAAPHLKIDVQNLDCDFYTFSAHKMYGPTGVGILYGKEKWLNALPPYHGGGEMIKSVSFEETTYNDLPFKFEAGTPNIADVIAFGTSIDYINSIGIEAINQHEQDLLEYATDKLLQINGLKIIGTAKHKAAVISFVFDKIHPSDIGTILDQQGIAIRTGHHCTQPLMSRFKIPGTSRASFAMYNTFEEVDMLINGLQLAIKMLQ